MAVQSPQNTWPRAIPFRTRSYNAPSNLIVSSTLWFNFAHSSGLSTDERGISSSFLKYFKSLDESVSAKALGPDQTISSKVTSTIQSATAHVKTLDEQKGYTRVAGDVCEHLHLNIYFSFDSLLYSIIRAPWVLRLASACDCSILRLRSMSLIYMKKPFGSQTRTRPPSMQLRPSLRVERLQQILLSLRSLRRLERTEVYQLITFVVCVLNTGDNQTRDTTGNTANRVAYCPKAVGR